MRDGGSVFYRGGRLPHRFHAPRRRQSIRPPPLKKRLLTRERPKDFPLDVARAALHIFDPVLATLAHRVAREFRQLDCCDEPSHNWERQSLTTNQSVLAGVEIAGELRVEPEFALPRFINPPCVLILVDHIVLVVLGDEINPPHEDKVAVVV